MSHFTRIKTQIVDKEYLLKALDELGYEYETGSVEVRGLAGERTRAEVKVKLGLGREIGFRRVSGTYDVVADTWGLGINLKDFSQKVTQRYAYHTTIARLQAQGFDLVGEEQAQDGQIRLTLRRMA